MKITSRQLEKLISFLEIKDEDIIQKLRDKYLIQIPECKVIKLEWNGESYEEINEVYFFKPEDYEDVKNKLKNGKTVNKCVGKHGEYDFGYEDFEFIEDKNEIEKLGIKRLIERKEINRKYKLKYNREDDWIDANAFYFCDLDEDFGWYEDEEENGD